MRKVDTRLLMKTYQTMKQYQASIYPFTPTVEELREVWGFKSVATVRYWLGRLEKYGLVRSRQRGKVKNYSVRHVFGRGITATEHLRRQVNDA